MRLILVDKSGDHRRNFHPLTLSRPLWELRCGMTSLGEKLQGEGVVLFEKSYDELLGVVEERRRAALLESARTVKLKTF